MTGQVVTDWDVAEVEWTMSHGESRTDVMLRLGPLGVWFSPDGKWFAGNEVVTAVRPLRLFPQDAVDRIDAAIRELCAEQPADFRAHAALNILNGGADQSLPSAPRDGLDGSDEAAWKVRLRQQVAEAALDRHDDDRSLVRLVAINDAFPFIEAAVRAEAVAEERQRALGLIEDRIVQDGDGSDRDKGRLSGLLELQPLVGAGSVPVATPEPCTSQCSKPADVTCAEWGCRPAADGLVTWAELAEVVDRLGMDPALAGVLYSRSRRPAAPSVGTPVQPCTPQGLDALPLVGTGTPAEEVSGGGGHAERQHERDRRTIAYLLDMQERGSRQLHEAWDTIEHYIAAMATLRTERDELRGQLADAEAGWASAVKVNQRMSDEVARYRAAIETALNELRPSIAGLNRTENINFHRHALIRGRDVLAAALGDGD